MSQLNKTFTLSELHNNYPHCLPPLSTPSLPNITGKLDLIKNTITVK